MLVTPLLRCGSRDKLKRRQIDKDQLGVILNAL
jgi:hypothetical protein